MLCLVSLMLMLADRPVHVQATAGQLHDKLSADVARYSLSAGSLFQALHRVASDFALPMGIEWVRGARTQQSVHLTWEHATVSQILREVVGSYGGYYTELDDGIVNVRPDEYRKDDRGSILNIAISRFEVRNEPLGVANWKLHAAVQAILRPPHSPPTGRGVASSIAYGAGGDRRVSLISERASLREILNRLAMSASEVVWVVTYLDDKQATARIRTTVIATGDIVPLDQQPVWSFIPWGLDIVGGGVIPSRSFGPPAGSRATDASGGTVQTLVEDYFQCGGDIM
jgi:hypothetical protein